MKKLLLLMFFFTSISNAQVAPLGMFTNQTIIIGDFSGPSKIYLGQNVPLSNSILGGTWSSLNPSVATIDSTTGEITGVGLGTATINYQITQNGRTESDTKTVEVTESLAIGTGYGGGVIAYIYQSGDPGYSSTEITMLIAAINDFPETLTWYKAGLKSWNSGCISCNPDNLLLGAGQTNTENIAFNLSIRGPYPPNDYIFGAISSFRDGDFEDWFVPSRDELIKVQLQKDAINGFSASNYWTSNDDMSNSRGTTVNFADGSLFAKAKNQVGATRLIRYASFTPTAPGAPTNVAANAGNGQATVTFEAPISNGGYAITEYTVTSNPGSHTQSGTNSPIIVTGLTNGTEYTFKVTAINAVGTSTFSVASSAVTPATVPSIPTNVTANAGNGQATLTFEAPISDGGSTITEYTVTSSNGNTQTGASSPITVTGLTNGTAYTFTVTAKNVMGTSGESSVSNAVTPATVPGAPTNVAANAGNGQATVTFEAPISDGGYAITEYTVTSNPGSHTQSGTNSPIIVTGLTNGTEYTFKVTATNALGTSTFSVASSAVTPATVPSVPTNVTANAGNGQATVTFEAPISDGGYAITEYTVTSNPGSHTQSGTNSPIIVTGLTNGTEYTFKVTAINALGTSTFSVASSAVTPATVPSIPTNVTANAGNGQATVTFEAPISDGGYAITEYTVTSNPGSHTQTGTSSPITVTGLTNGTAYTFTVTASNSVGPSGASLASSVITPMATVPGVPTNVTANAGNGQATVTFEAPISDGGYAITGYTVTSNDGLIQNGASSPITVTGLTNGTAYTFKVTATNALGTSGESSVSNAVTPAPVPSPPTNVFAVTGNREATVTFEAPISDGGYAITGYTVTSNDGLIQNGSKSPIVIKSLVKRNLYTFTVTATNPMGTSDASSESNQITAVASPTPPILLADKPIGDRQVTLKFKAPLDDGGTPVTSYTAFCYKEDGRTLVGTISVDAADVPSTTKSIVYTGLTNGTKYGFRIIAYNSVGSSPKGTNLQYATLD